MHYLRLLTEGSNGLAAVVVALALTSVMVVISAVPSWSARATQLLPPGARLLTPFSDRDEGGAIQITHLMQRLVAAHVSVEVLRGVRQGHAWLPSVEPPWPLLALR